MLLFWLRNLLAYSLYNGKVNYNDVRMFSIKKSFVNIQKWDSISWEIERDIWTSKLPIFLEPIFRLLLRRSGNSNGKKFCNINDTLKRVIGIGAWTRAPWTKAPRRQKLKVFSTLFLGKSKLKQRNYIRTKLRLKEFNKRENLIQKR